MTVENCYPGNTGWTVTAGGAPTIEGFATAQSIDKGDSVALKVNASVKCGGNAVWGEYFSGKLDDVRVYNRALSAAEVAADMNRAAP